MTDHGPQIRAVAVRKGMPQLVSGTNSGGAGGGLPRIGMLNVKLSTA